MPHADQPSSDLGILLRELRLIAIAGPIDAEGFAGKPDAQRTFGDGMLGILCRRDGRTTFPRVPPC